jgi:peptidoglycan/LPS O-acetylase OafA/YrhL
MQNIFNIPRNYTYSFWLSLIRMLMALFVLFVHIAPWFAYCEQYTNSFFVYINTSIVKIFQSSSETNPAVLGFITLSGYCIHRNGLRLNEINVHHFFIRRFFRIIPLLLIGVFLGIAVFSIVGGDQKIQAITGTTNLSIFAIFYKLSGLHAFIPFNFASVYQGNGPLITCEVEVWLYIFYPVLMRLIVLKGSRFFWVLLIVMTTAGAIFCSIFPNIAKWWHNGSLFGFLIYWWIGVYSVDLKSQILHHFKSIFCTYIILTATLFYYPNTFLIVELRKVFFALLIGILLKVVDGNGDKVFIGRSFFESGFSLYALHTPLICLALAYSINFYCTALAIILLSWLSYLYIEKPFIAIGRIVVASKTQNI